MDAPSSGANMVPEKTVQDKRMEVYEELIDLMECRWKIQDPAFKKAIYKYLYNRIICNMSMRESALKADKETSHETFRQWEAQIFDFYKLYLIGL